MLCDYADESFDRAEYNAVNHNRGMLLSVRTCIFKVESSRELIVKLNRAALPGSAEGILNMEVKLRTIESTVSRIQFIFLADGSNCIRKRIFCLFPIFARSDVVFRHS